MEPVTLTATAITSLLFSEALKEGGKALGKGVSEQVSQLLSAIRQKFRAVGTEGLLTRAQNQPTEGNKSIFQTVLETQMTEDEEFANHLSELIKQLESAEVTRQVMARGIEAKGNLELEDATQEAKRGKQEMATELKGEDIKLKNLNQKQTE
ncbi:MAG TPA: hypothetical protein V6D14_27020 [Coleofasciculaceae cyanobacterium]|jgi:hypothetical protein